MQNKNNQFKQWKQEYRIIHRKQEQSEKTVFRFLSSYCAANAENADKIGKVLTEREQREVETDKQQTGALKKLKKIYESIDGFKQTLKYFEHTNEYLVRVQKESEGIVTKMEVMKGEMADRYDELDAIEYKLTADLELWDRKIDGYENGEDYEQKHQKEEIKRVVRKTNNSPKGRKDGPESKADKSSCMQELKIKETQQQVQNIDASIQELGRHLGWPKEDHQDFLTIWNRNCSKNYFEIEDQLCGYFNFYTNQQIQDHMNKYMKLNKLHELKKELIQEYKQLKERKKQMQIAKMQSHQAVEEAALKKEVDRKRQEEEQKMMKVKVEKWRKEKEKRRVLEQQLRKEQEEAIKRMEADKRKAQESKRKQILEHWKEEREVLKQRQSAHSIKRPSSAVNQQSLQRVKEREEKIRNQELQRLVRKKMQKEQLEKKAEKIKEHKMIKYAHVASKLEKETTAIKEKKREKFDGKQKKEANTFGGQLLLTGARAVPEWRQGL